MANHQEPSEWGTSSRAQKERFYQRRVTVVNKLGDMQVLCNAESLLIMKRNGRYYVHTTDPDDKRWSAVLETVV